MLFEKTGRNTEENEERQGTGGERMMRREKEKMRELETTRRVNQRREDEGMGDEKMKRQTEELKIRKGGRRRRRLWNQRREDKRMGNKEIKGKEMTREQEARR